MTSLLLLTIALSVVIITIVKHQKPVSKKKKSPYKSKPLMTENEIEFFGRLKAALPNHHIFAQVSLGALIQPVLKEDDENFWKVRNTFSQKIADYIVCDSKMKVVSIIELDDRTHDAENDKARDEIARQAGYKTIRWQSKNKPSVEEIAKAFKK